MSFSIVLRWIAKTDRQAVGQVGRPIDRDTIGGYEIVTNIVLLSKSNPLYSRLLHQGRVQNTSQLWVKYIISVTKTSSTQ